MATSPGSKSSSPASTRKTPQIECTDALRLTAAFVNGGLERKAVRLLRGHLDQCEDCLVAYRASLEAAGRLGASLRESKQPALNRETASERNKRIVELASRVGRKQRRPFALRAVLLTAAMIFSAGWIAQLMDFPNPAEVVWLAGEVGVGEATLGSENEGEQLIASNWCWTGAFSRARVELASTTIELAANTQLQLENRDKLSFRLRAGSLVVDGPCEVLTPLGMVRVHSGLATMGYLDNQLSVESKGGEVEYLSSLGSHEIHEGDPPFIVN